ncbi:Calmodulin-binding transcription activator 1 [Labeo rohita]|uniref:Calmodulin-binding transcription activator 1 n=1 Tax=Labeo rohita TaxID=84645 RepID=A0ABQ8LG24_LABRO|nr:Calmodulin-binding transcription activator 1 [Labeo rohita]
MSSQNHMTHSGPGRPLCPVHSLATWTNVAPQPCLYGCYVHSSIIPTFHRRCYWLLQPSYFLPLFFAFSFGTEQHTFKCNSAVMETGKEIKRNPSARWSLSSPTDQS